MNGDTKAEIGFTGESARPTKAIPALKQDHPLPIGLLEFLN